MVIQHNMTAMNSNRMLGITTGGQAKSSEKLSSGYKINRAADDAAGLSISEKMRKQMRGLDRASTNADDGVSSVQTAEGALTEVHDMLQRMNELAVQAANGTNSETDRISIQNEIQQLTTEIDRVAETTKFNETYLLKGSTGFHNVYMKAHDAGLEGVLGDAGIKASFRMDIKDDSNVKIAGKEYHVYTDDDSIASIQQAIQRVANIAADGFSVESRSQMWPDGIENPPAGKNAYEYDKIEKTEKDGITTYTSYDKNGNEIESWKDKIQNRNGEWSNNPPGTRTDGITSVAYARASMIKQTVVIDGTSYVTALDSSTHTEVVFKFGEQEFSVEEIKAKVKDGTIVSVSDGDSEWPRTAVDETLDKNIHVSTAVSKVMDALVQANRVGVDPSKLSEVKVTLKPTRTAAYADTTGTYTGGIKDTGDLINGVDDVFNRDPNEKNARWTKADDGKTRLTGYVGAKGGTYVFSISKSTAQVAKDLGISLHVGSDADMTNKIGVRIKPMTAASLGIQNLTVADSTGIAATYAIDAIEDALKQVSEQRSELGAVQNRLEHTIKNLDNVVENTTAAESRIRDTDMADEMVTYSKNNILAQAGQSMLAQANQSTQGVMSLLQG
ncbi:flagellin N-terminal helical domain-containing protein [Butyrivibrio sp. WCE2006]|uniref:flagellin N-terminal helical domain-containing protein n=1 Tax=Butyrivibrio sp. WCE2006 TaxID=1410611 RepID=UPI0005D14307|nr:flagellin [Butyrivibrio sp. WCE2006]